MIEIKANLSCSRKVSPPVWPADQSGLGLPGLVYLGADHHRDLLRDVATLLSGHVITLVLQI